MQLELHQKRTFGKTHQVGALTPPNCSNLTLFRKHTGERPFQCHCNRRFSRLDNLRQHAQTVHVNEDIPGDSLAATGTRFQRQIRTDRVRPPGARARSGTAGSQGSHSRGHSRNLSTSSIGSTASNFSAAPEPRRRPPPLIMANDPSRSRMSADTSSPPTTPTSQYAGYPGDSPGGFSTPTSTAYSTGPGSPTFGSNYASPSRSGLFGGPPPARRLSVPASGNPFMSPHGHSGPPPYMSPLAPSNSYSSNSSVFGSPTSSNFSFSRADPNLSAEAEWRRRTWHPTTYTYSGNVMNYSRPATSGLSYSQTPDAPQPAFATNATAAAGPAPRLPGIESFDQVQHRPSTPPRRQLSPIRGDAGSSHSGYGPQTSALRSHPSGPDHRRGHVSWDLSMDSNMSRLDLQGNAPKDASQWGQQTLTEIHEVATRPHQSDRPPPIVSQQAVQPGPPPRPQLYGHDAQTAATQRSKRHGWYNGPLQPAAQIASTSRTSPEDSSSSDGVPTPGTSAAEYHPAIIHSNGYVEHHRPAVPVDGSSIVSPLIASFRNEPNLTNLQPCAPPQTQSHSNYISHHAPPSRAEYYSAPPPPRHDLGRLEALVAVATSEDNAATTAR